MIKKSSLFVAVFTLCLSILINTAYSQSTPAEHRSSINGYRTFYDSKDQLCSTSPGGVLGALDGTNQSKDVYQSGLSGPYILEQFAIHVLKRLSQKYEKPESDFVTLEHTVALVAFSMGEGGDIMNRSIFNPMNLGYSDDDVAPVAYAAGGVDGRQSYPSFDQGVEAYARQMSSGTQSRLGYTLSLPDSTAEDFMNAITYFDQYEGNKFWAEASLANPVKYYNERLNLIKTVKSNYATTAGLVIGTAVLEQKEGIYDSSKIYYKDLLNGESSITAQSSIINASYSNPCINTAGLSSGSSLSIVQVAEREYSENAGVKEFGGDILTYTDNNVEHWCADFVSWVFKDAGYPYSGGYSGGWRIPSVESLRSFYINNHIYFKVGTQTPQPGDIAFYIGKETPDPSSTRHVNVVVSVDTATNTMITIGGNESDQVRKQTRSITYGSYELVGFGRLKSTGILVKENGLLNPILGAINYNEKS